jgi:hypothetical protein
MSEKKKTYKEMYLEQNAPYMGLDKLDGDLLYLFDILHPYQMWSENNDSHMTIRTEFKAKYEGQLSIFFNN